MPKELRVVNGELQEAFTTWGKVDSTVLFIPSIRNRVPLSVEYVVGDELDREVLTAMGERLLVYLLTRAPMTVTEYILRGLVGHYGVPEEER